MAREFIELAVALLIVAGAFFYLVERLFGVRERFGWGARKSPPVKLGGRLARGLKDVQRRQ